MTGSARGPFCRSANTRRLSGGLFLSASRFAAGITARPLSESPSTISSSSCFAVTRGLYQTRDEPQRRFADFVRSKYSHAGVSVNGLRMPLAMCRQVPRPKSWSSMNCRQPPQVFGASAREPNVPPPRKPAISSRETGWGAMNSSSVTWGCRRHRSWPSCSWRRSCFRFFRCPTHPSVAVRPRLAERSAFDCHRFELAAARACPLSALHAAGPAVMPCLEGREAVRTTTSMQHNGGRQATISKSCRRDLMLLPAVFFDHAYNTWRSPGSNWVPRPRGLLEPRDPLRTSDTAGQSSSRWTLPVWLKSPFEH